MIRYPEKYKNGSIFLALVIFVALMLFSFIFASGKSRKKAYFGKDRGGLLSEFGVSSSECKKIMDDKSGKYRDVQKQYSMTMDGKNGR